MSADSPRLPIALRLAQLARVLPDLRGRDRLLASLMDSVPRLDRTITGTFGGGLRFEGNPARDANVLELLLLRFARPALAPVLDAALGPGAAFADVGANLGLYTLWGARRVGAQGRVHAFEPVPEVRAQLERNVTLNGFENVRIVASGLGAEAGALTLYRAAGASGVTSRYLASRGDAVEVRVTTLDAEFPDPGAAPDLVKIDVEGMEIEVLRGARALLGGPKPPLVVLETNETLFRAAGTDYRELAALLARAGGYTLFALRPAGLREEPADARTPGSLNVLAARRDQPAHARTLERLRRVRFARNMNA